MLCRYAAAVDKKLDENEKKKLSTGKHILLRKKFKRLPRLPKPERLRLHAQEKLLIKAFF